MQNGRLLSVLLLTLAASQGCEVQEAPPVGESTSRDSAGVTIVENTGGSWKRGDVWEVPLEPLVEVGAAEGKEEYSFGFVSDAVRLSDGRLIVLDQMAELLRAFDERGLFIGNWAQRGQGPGELSRAEEIVRLPADSVLVSEFMGSGSVFDSEGRFVRQFRVPAEEWSMGDFSTELSNWSRYGLVGYLSDGSYLVQLRAWVERSPGVHPERVGLARLTESGTGDTLAVLTTGAFEVQDRGDGMAVTSTHFDPQVLAGTHDGQVYASDALSYSYRVYSEEGTLDKVVRLTWPRTAVTKDLKARWRKNRSQYWGRALEPGVPPGRLQQLFEQTPYPDSLPAFAALRVDAEGNVWGEATPVEGWPSPSPVQYVFDPTGAFLGVVHMPRGLRITDIGADYVMGVWRDENDVDYVRLYRLSKDE